MAVDLPRIDVEASRAFWPRTETALNTTRVEELAQHIDDELSTINTARGDTFAEGLAIFDPIVLVPDSTGRTYLIADGHHRIAAYQSREKAIQAATGWKHVVIKAQVLPTGSDVFVEAARRAIITATPLKPGERASVIKRIKSEHKDMSTRQIARAVGVSQPYVQKVLKGDNQLSPSQQSRQSAVAPSPIEQIIDAMLAADNEQAWPWGAPARAVREEIERYGDNGRGIADLIKRWAKYTLDGAKSYRPQR